MPEDKAGGIRRNIRSIVKPASSPQCSGMTQTLGNRLGPRLKALRKARGLTQLQLADLMQKSVETISNFERGKTIPSLLTLDRLAERLHVPMKDFFEETDAVQAEPELSEAAQTIRNAIECLPEEDLETLAGLAKVLEKRRQ